MKISYKQFGEKTILIEWPALIQEDILRDIIRYKAVIFENISQKIEDCIVGYNSLAVKYHTYIKDYESARAILEKLYDTDHKIVKWTSYLYELPVCYDAPFGIDLEDMSRQLKLSVKELIELHSSTIYTVYFIGFLPGFLYLGGLDKRLHLARKATPGLRVPKGAVAIGGHQTGVYPMQSAGGWHIMGNTPVALFDIQKELPCFAQSGDQIKFSSVSLEEYSEIKERIEQGNYQLSKTLLHA